jgi:hypothetical protein
LKEIKLSFFQILTLKNYNILKDELSKHLEILKEENAILLADKKRMIHDAQSNSNLICYERKLNLYISVSVRPGF